MAAQPRPWFRLGSIVRPVGPAPVPAPTPAPAAAPTPTPAPAPLVRTTSLRPLAPPPPPEPTPPPPATQTQPQPAAPVAQPPAATAPPPSPPTAATIKNTSVPSSPARGVSSAPSASLANSPRPREASPPSPVIGITSGSSSVPPSPGNRVAPYSSSVVASPRATVTSSVPNSPATTRAVPPPQVSPPKSTAIANSVPQQISSPPKSTAIANSVPQQTYSPPKPRSTNISSPNPVREPSPNYNSSSRSIKPVNNTTPPSPNRFKPTAPPPSPLNLPASQLKSNTAYQTDQPRIPLEAEQKTVLVQKTVDQKSNSWFGSGGSKQDRDFNRESPKPSTHSHNEKHDDKHYRKKLSSDSEEAPGMRVITIAGENKGAYMELIRSPNKHHDERGERSHFFFKKGNASKTAGQTIGSHESDQSYSTSSGDEGKPKIKDKNYHRGNKAGQSSQLPMSAYMNSNVQGINNSIMYNSNCTHHDPGVHLSLARKPSGDGFDVKNHANGHHS